MFFTIWIIMMKSCYKLGQYRLTNFNLKKAQFLEKLLTSALLYKDIYKMLNYSHNNQWDEPMVIILIDIRSSKTKPSAMFNNENNSFTFVYLTLVNIFKGVLCYIFRILNGFHN